MMLPLKDVRIIDLTWYITGPYCTKLLADAGADLIKVERPGTGDPVREWGPFKGHKPHHEKSGLFFFLNTSKKSITLNLKAGEGRCILKKLAQKADILIESFRPGVLQRLGLSYRVLQEVNPKLLVVSISNFGQSGPYRDFKASELVLSGIGGEMHLTGIPDREPLRMAGNLMQFQAGLMAAVATMIGLLSVRKRGWGEHLDISIMESNMVSASRRTAGLVGFQYTGETNSRTTQRANAPPFGIYPCKDGYFGLSGGGNFFFPRTCTMLGKPELAQDPRFSTRAAMADPENREDFEQNYFLPWILSQTRQEAWAAAQRANIPSAPVNTFAEVVHNPHLKERNYFVELDHCAMGKISIPGASLRMSRSPCVVKPAPLLGEHNLEIYSALGLSPTEIQGLAEKGIV